MKNYKEFKELKESVSDKSDKRDLDPFDEEDWDEIDGHHSIFKVWVGATSREIKLLCFPAHIQMVKNKIYIKNDRFKTIYKNLESKFEEIIYRGIVAGNCFIIDEKNYKVEDIVQFVQHYSDSREQSCISNIRSYKETLSGDYERDEDDEPIDEDKLEERLNLEEILLENIKEFKKGIKIDINKLLKMNDF